MAERRHEGEERRNPDHLREIIREEMKEANKQLLLAIGINPDHPLEAQNDMAFLRSMRTRCEKAGMGAAAAVITIVIGGVLSVFALGFKAWMGK
jgi:phosphomevalonate kinase